MSFIFPRHPSKIKFPKDTVAYYICVHIHIWTLYAYIHANTHTYVCALDTCLIISSLQLNSISSVFMQRLLHTISVVLSLNLVLQPTLPSLVSPCWLNPFSKILEEKIGNQVPGFPDNYLYRQVFFMNNVRDLIWHRISLPHSIFPTLLVIRIQHHRANPASVKGKTEPDSSRSSKSRF